MKKKPSVRVSPFELGGVAVRSRDFAKPPQGAQTGWFQSRNRWERILETLRLRNHPVCAAKELEIFLLAQPPLLT